MSSKGKATFSPRILVEGIGAIGGIIAAKLIHAGYAPTLVTGNTEISSAGKGSNLAGQGVKP